MKKLIQTSFWRKHLYPTTTQTDRLVFFIPEGSHYKVLKVDLPGTLSLTDKIIKYCCVDRGFDHLPANTIGPFYVGGLTDPTVQFEPWESFVQFRDLVNQEYFKRKHMSVLVDDDGVTIKLEGRALNDVEFNHLYLTDTDYMRLS